MPQVLNVFFGVDPEVCFFPLDPAVPGTGELGVPGGNEILDPVLELAPHILPIDHGEWEWGLSADQHPEDTEHFKRWPKHGRRNTPGGKFHPRLCFLQLGACSVFEKGLGTKDDGYSAVEGVEERTYKTFDQEYSSRTGNRSDIVFYVWGLATDYCVRATVLDMLKLGYRVVLLTDAIRAVNIKPGDGERAIAEMVAAGAVCKTTKDIIAGWRLTA